MEKEQKIIAYKAIDTNIEHTTARQIVRYVMECELWGQDTVSPTNQYLSKKYNWSIETTKVAISKAKKSQFITTTGYGKNRCLELNVSFLKGKMAEIFHKNIKQKIDFSDIIPNNLPNTSANGLANTSANGLANTSANSFEEKKGSTKPQKKKNKKDNNNSNNNNNNNIPFEKFWDMYDYKKSRPLAEKKWNSLTDREREQAIKALPDYVGSTNKDGTFPSRKHPATWLNQKCWEDEIVKTKSNYNC